MTGRRRRDALAGKRILLTGATSGIGRAATGQLLDLGAEVLVVGRDEQRTIKAVAELDIAHPNGTVSAHIADLADLAAVRKLADDLARLRRAAGRHRPQRRRPPGRQDDDR